MDIIKKIIEARKAYYRGGSNKITDQEYDALEDFLRELQPDHPLLKEVGYTPSKIWEQETHNIFMGSLFKINKKGEFIKWAHKINSPLCLQYKLDGLSISLDYKNGCFYRAVTRGDGKRGEVITQNVLMMKGLKLKLDKKFTGSIRGEIVLLKTNFNKINLISEKKYSNCRNAAAGISRRLDGEFCSYLNIICYDMTEPLDEPDKIKKQKHWGFDVTESYLGSLENLIEKFNEISKEKEFLPFDIDGMVIKVCSNEIQRNLGVVNNRPKGQIAWKFDPPGAVTRLKRVSWEIGRTGVITPVGCVESVNIGGSNIEKVTLHNIAEIVRLGIGINDQVILTKQGEVIPKIVSVLKHEDNPIKIPTECPSCGLKLINDGIKLMCLNDECPRKIFHRILNWVKVTEIDTFGQSLAEELYKTGKLCSIADIYRLKLKDIADIERWGDKSAYKIIENINKTKHMKPVKFLCALGIPTISEATSGELLGAFETVKELMEKSVEDIVKLKGFSDISASRVVTGLLKNKEEINFLLTIITLQTEGSHGVLEGQSFCFTGAMEKPRSHYQAIVTQLGGTNKKSVVKDLSYLVCNEDKRSSKSVKAEEHGVKVITEKEFLGITGNTAPEKEPEPEPEKLIEDCGTLFDEE